MQLSIFTLLATVFAADVADATYVISAPLSQETFMFTAARLSQITEMNAIMYDNQVNTAEIMRILDYFHFPDLKMI